MVTKVPHNDYSQLVKKSPGGDLTKTEERN
jgi:hypothetical protein